MHTVLESSTGEAVALAVRGQARPARITTTLGELITALQDVVGQDDARVVATIVHLVRSGRLTLLGAPSTPRRIRPW
jgi:hypothetical protein